MLQVYVVFLVFYVVVNLWNEAITPEGITSYEIFLVVTDFWMVLASFYFLKNATSNYLLQEYKLYCVTFTLLNLYALVRYAISINDMVNVKGCHIFSNGTGCNSQSMSTAQDILLVTQFVFDITGLTISLPLVIMTLIITFIAYDYLREVIYLHLEGNKVLYKNYQNMTFTRAILKVDFLANLEYFTAFIFVLFNDEET